MSGAMRKFWVLCKVGFCVLATYLLAATGFGLVCYGIFNFIRARHEKFGR